MIKVFRPTMSKHLLGLGLAGLGLLFLSFPAQSQAQAASAPSAEQRTAQAYEAARAEGQPALEMFLRAMPKGGDLHLHLVGAVYAETFLADAAHDNICVNVDKLSLDAHHRAPDCPQGEVAASGLPNDQNLYDHLVDSFSVRTFVPTTDDSGHDQFFASFARFGGLSSSHDGEWVSDVAARAASQNEQYLEIMMTPPFAEAAAMAEKVGFSTDYSAYRARLMAAGFGKLVPEAQAYFNEAQAGRKAIEHCGDPGAAPACKVEVRFIYQVLRNMPPPVVFAQILLGFETAASDPEVVGINLVQPEDAYYSLHDYTLHMQMIAALHKLYPQVGITLHAGELTLGLVPPSDLRFHIRQAVEIAQAQRIGHGVDIAYENNPVALLHEMAKRHVMVEVNLTSNADILGVKGKDHPFMLYRAYGVPVALSTDDEGVERIDLTDEYVTAAETYPLSYQDLKLLARTSIEHAFLPGASLWQSVTPERLTTPVAVCRGQLGEAKPVGACAAFVDHSQKAQQEWELERRFHLFEAGY